MLFPHELQAKRDHLFRYDIALVVERNVDGSACFRSFASPDAVVVFGEARDIGVPGRLNAGFRLALCRRKIEMSPGVQSRDDTRVPDGHEEERLGLHLGRGVEQRI